MLKSQILRGLFVVLMLFFFAGCSIDEPKSEVPAWELINNNALLVDVRTEKEFHNGHLPGAKLIPISQVEQRLSEFGDDKDRQIVLYCKGGVRAAKAEEILKKQGYTQVVNAGGYQDLLASQP